MVLALTLFERAEYGLQSPIEAGDPGVLAGTTRLRFRGFCFWMTLGKGLRYLVIALATLNFF